MKKKYLVIAILGMTILSAAAVYADAGFTLGFNVEFPNYTSTFIGPSFSYNPTIAKDLELNVGATLDILRHGTEVQADVPIKIGFNYLFADSNGFVPYIGLGIMPDFNLSSDQQDEFLLGPYVSEGFRVKLLPLLSYFLEADETLLIGPPAWINTSLRVTTGFAFRVTE